MSKTSRRWFIHLRGTQCFCQMFSWSPERSSQTTRPSVYLRLTRLKLIIPPRVVIRRRLVCVFREIVKVAGVGGRGDLDQRTRLSPEGWRPSAGGEGIRNTTYVRRDGRSQSSFPQTLPVKPFIPPDHRTEKHLNLVSVLLFTYNTLVPYVPLWPTHLCFWMSFTPFFWFPSLSDGLSLSTQMFALRKQRPDWPDGAAGTSYLQSFLMRLLAFFVTFLGNSTMSMPLRMML